MLNQKSFFLRSISLVAFANLITKPLWLFLFIYAARLLGPYQFGIYTFAISIVIILSILIDFGFDYIAVREISINKELFNPYVNNIILFRIFFAVLFVILIFLYDRFFIKFDDSTLEVIIILILFQVSVIILQFIKATVSAFHDFNKYSRMLIFEKLLLVTFGFTSLSISNKLIYFLISLLIANFISVIFFFFIINKKFNFSLKPPSYDILLYLIKNSLPLLVMNIFIMAYFRVDVLILNWILKDKNVVGIYGSIHRLIEMFFLVPTIIMSTAYPIITKSYNENRSYVIDLVKKLLNLLLIISLPIVFIISFNSYEFNYFLFGEKYRMGYQGLIFIVWTILPLGFNYVLGHILIATNKQKYCAISLSIASIVNLLLNIALIPLLSFVGTSLALFITELIIFFLYCYYTNKFLGDLRILVLIKRIVIIVGSIFIYFLLYEHLFGYNIIINSLSIMIITTMFFLKFKMIDPIIFSLLMNRTKI